MPISLGGLLSGATSAVTGAQQGKLDRKKYEEEAMRQLLAQQLTEAQIGQYQQSAQDRASQAAEAQRQRELYDQLRASNPEYANLPDDVLGQVAAAGAKPTKDPNWDTVLTDQGYVQVNPATGEKRPLGLKPPPQTRNTNSTEGERRAAGLYMVAEDAYKRLESAIAPNIKDYLAGKVPLGLGQAAISARQQAQNQAGAQFYRSYLYITSGATVNEGEALEAAKMFIPQWGDSPDLVRQKLASQKTMLAAMRTIAGRAAPDEQPEARGGGQYDEFLRP